jgi:hypothetical protein
MVGIGLTNLDSVPATLTFTAIDDDGNQTAGQGITNPATLTLNPNAQLPILDYQILGDGLLSSNSNGWVELQSTTVDTNGFFLIFDSQLNFMDGANFADNPLTDFAFTEIETDGYNKISIINNNSESTGLSLELVGADGTVRGSQSQVIGANGALTADLFGDLFVGIQPDATDYVRVKSDKGVQSFHVMRQNLGDISVLAGQDTTTGATTLYSPQYVIGWPWRTSLSVINLDPSPGVVSFRVFGQDGIQLGATNNVPIPANGKIYIDDPGFFMTPYPGAVTVGYVEIVSDGVRLAGNTVFGDINRQSFCSALALISSLQTSVLYSHVASNDMYYTGIAILNPNPTDAAVTLDLHAADGTLIQSTNLSIGAGQRLARVLTEYFPILKWNSQTSGYVQLTSNMPIASFALFGTNNLSVLSAIPPQAIK